MTKRQIIDNWTDKLVKSDDIFSKKSTSVTKQLYDDFKRDCKNNGCVGMGIINQMWQMVVDNLARTLVDEAGLSIIYNL